MSEKEIARVNTLTLASRGAVNLACTGCGRAIKTVSGTAQTRVPSPTRQSNAGAPPFKGPLPLPLPLTERCRWGAHAWHAGLVSQCKRGEEGRLCSPTVERS